VAAALGDGDGVAVIAGTGSIAFARRAGVLHRFGGFGYLLGDGGSGFAVGRDAILYALRAEERGATDTPLTALVRKHCGMPRVLDAVGKLYEGGKREIASYARTVFEAHAAGDSAATAILEENAAAIAALARASDAVFGNGVRRVVLVGGMVTGEDPYAEMIGKALEDDRYLVSVCRVSAVYGALRLAGLKGEETC
jgi:N-acetylglucosamine kinase-like BadF-type ATPase